MDHGERILWQHQDEHRVVECLMRSCCAGAELQVRERQSPSGGEQLVVRELYPTKSDLYERARQLRQAYGGGSRERSQADDEDPSAWVRASRNIE